MFTDKQFHWAAKVADFMIKLAEKYHERYNKAEHGIPYGDMAYGQALEHWHKHGCPKDAWFSYAESERPCAVLMEFRVELSAHFGLSIFTAEEAKARQMMTKKPVKAVKVEDWGIN